MFFKRDKEGTLKKLNNLDSMDAKQKVQLCKYGPLEAVREALKRGSITVDERIDYGFCKYAPLSWAVQMDEPDPAIIELLIQSGSDVDVRDLNLDTPLMIAADNNKNTDAMSLLLQHGADINAKNESGWTPIMHAAILNKKTEIFSFLLKNGACATGKDEDGFTVLMHACGGPVAPETIRMLLDAGAANEINERNQYGESAFILLCSNFPNLEIIHMLLDAGADISARDNDKNNALILACKWDSAEAVQFLINSGMSVTDVNGGGVSAIANTAAYSLEPSLIKLLLDNGADINIPDSDGSTPLMYSVCCSKCPDMLRTLISAGADVNLKDGRGNTALMLAAGRKSDIKEFFSILIAAGADKNTKNNAGLTVKDCLRNNKNISKNLRRKLIDSLR